MANLLLIPKVALTEVGEYGCHLLVDNPYLVGYICQILLLDLGIILGSINCIEFLEYQHSCSQKVKK